MYARCAGDAVKGRKERLRALSLLCRTVSQTLSQTLFRYVRRRSSQRSLLLPSCHSPALCLRRICADDLVLSGDLPVGVSSRLSFLNCVSIFCRCIAFFILFHRSVPVAAFDVTILDVAVWHLCCTVCCVLIVLEKLHPSTLASAYCCLHHL